MKITISVTADDIAKGVPESGCDCPIALALKRMLPSLPGLYVGSMSLYPFGLPDIPSADADSILLDVEAQAFIYEFDGAQAVAPFRFALDVPDELLPAGGVS